MKVTIDAQPIPVDASVIFSMEEKPQITFRGPFNQDNLTFFRAVADGQPHEIDFFIDGETTPYIIAHAKFEIRFVSGPNRPEGDVEVSGIAWGTPPNYDQFFVSG